LYGTDRHGKSGRRRTRGEKMKIMERLNGNGIDTEVVGPARDAYRCFFSEEEKKMETQNIRIGSRLIRPDGQSAAITDVYYHAPSNSITVVTEAGKISYAQVQTALERGCKII